MKGRELEFETGLANRIEVTARAWAKELAKYSETSGEPSFKHLQAFYEEFVDCLTKVQEMEKMNTVDSKESHQGIPLSRGGSPIISQEELVKQLRSLLKDDLQVNPFPVNLTDALVGLAKAATQFLSNQVPVTGQTAEIPSVRNISLVGKDNTQKGYTVTGTTDNKQEEEARQDPETTTAIRKVIDIFYKGSDCRRATNDLQQAMSELKVRIYGKDQPKNQQVAAQKAPQKGKPSTGTRKR